MLYIFTLYRKYKYKMIQSPPKEWYFLNNLRKKELQSTRQRKVEERNCANAAFSLILRPEKETLSGRAQHNSLQTGSKQHQDA
jgi:hypothetical protein